MAYDLSSILTSFQNAVNALNALVRNIGQETPSLSSGLMDADTLVQTDLVRVLGISVVVGGAAGGLYDAATITGAGAAQQLYVVDVFEGFYAVDMVFPTGLVYKPGAGQKAVIFYTRT